MSIHRIRFLCSLAAGAMLLWASVSHAQVRIPTENTIEDLQFFAPVESNAMSDRPYLKEGLFFNHDYLVWSVQRPRVAVIGDPNVVRNVVDTDTLLTFSEISSLNTGMYRDLLFDGNRTEIGWMRDGCGWMVGYTSLHESSHRVAQTHAP